MWERCLPAKNDHAVDLTDLGDLFAGMPGSNRFAIYL
jgi:hypothetical protein